jgi:hypothetical protein
MAARIAAARIGVTKSVGESSGSLCRGDFFILSKPRDAQIFLVWRRCRLVKDQQLGVLGACSSETHKKTVGIFTPDWLVTLFAAFLILKKSI